jgi:hypothetical protein
LRFRCLFGARQRWARYCEICFQIGPQRLAAPVKALALPASKLAKSGRIKKAGQRQFTRYFPVGQDAKPKSRSRRKVR